MHTIKSARERKGSIGDVCTQVMYSGILTLRKAFLLTFILTSLAPIKGEIRYRLQGEPESHMDCRKMGYIWKEGEWWQASLAWQALDVKTTSKALGGAQGIF